VDKTQQAAEPCVVFEHVTKRFGELVVFDDLSLALPKQQTTAIVGASGSGKTTLLQMVNALEQPDSGKVSVFGEPIPTQHLQQLTKTQRSMILPSDALLLRIFSYNIPFRVVII